MSTTEELSAGLARFTPRPRATGLHGAALERGTSDAPTVAVAPDFPLLTTAYRVAALVALVLALPLFVLIAATVALNSPGNPLFRQTRVGQAGRQFTLFKFRTMHVDAERRRDDVAHLNAMDDVLFKIRRDPRVFWVGRLLRRLSLDELPQLWNVVRGDMSLVGPRPPLPSEVKQYTARERQRLLVRPGLTGLWQVSGRSDLCWAESIELDLQYVSNRSPLFDLKIVARTLPCVLSGRGAY